MSFYGQNPFGSWRSRGWQQGQPLDYAAGSPAVASFFNAVYGWMAAGVGLTALVAFLISAHPASLVQFANSGTLIVLFIAQLALVWAVSGAVNRINATAATMLFLLYAAINGLLFSIVFLVYTKTSIAGVSIASAAMFGGMSVYGMTTGKDLSRWGSLLFGLLIGLIVATFVNMFLFSPGLSWLLSYFGVGLFAALTAYDTQRLKGVAMATADNPALAARLSVSGALMLYLDFINLFLYLVQIMGQNDRRR